MSTAANNTSNAVNVSGLNVLEETSERVPVSFITSSLVGYELSVLVLGHYRFLA